MASFPSWLKTCYKEDDYIKYSCSELSYYSNNRQGEIILKSGEYTKSISVSQTKQSMSCFVSFIDNNPDSYVDSYGIRWRTFTGINSDDYDVNDIPSQNYGNPFTVSIANNQIKKESQPYFYIYVPTSVANGLNVSLYNAKDIIGRNYTNRITADLTFIQEYQTNNAIIHKAEKYNVYRICLVPDNDQALLNELSSTTVTCIIEIKDKTNYSGYNSFIRFTANPN